MTNETAQALARGLGMREHVETFVGRHALVAMGGVRVRCEILNVRMSYGRLQYLVTPVSGSGEVYVETLFEVFSSPPPATNV